MFGGPLSLIYPTIREPRARRVRSGSDIGDATMARLTIHHSRNLERKHGRDRSIAFRLALCLPFCLSLVLTVFLTMGPFLALAQSLDSIIEDQITSDVESAIVDAVEQAVEDQVGDQVEQQVQDSVTNAIEQQLESSVTDAIEQSVESSVTDTLEQQVESGVTEAIEQQLEAGVLETLEQQIESGVVETLEQQIESGVAGTLEQQLESVLETDLESQIGEALELGLVSELEQRLPGESPILPLEPVTNALGQLTGSETGDDSQTSADSSNTLLIDLDDDGNAVEREIWVLLIPADQVERLDDWGFSVRSRQTLDALEAELVTIVAPEDRTLAEAALELALDAPGTVVDLNHVYRTDAEAATAQTVAMAVTTASPDDNSTGIAIGMIDTAVSIAHESLRNSTIIQKDFVHLDAPRPLAHGTAVASLLVGRSEQVSGYLQGGTLHAASVFLEDAEGMPAALTTALVEAVAWMAEQRVQVVNMSLSGPPNRALEAAIERAADRGLVIVAAVGNNGPHGAPLYPAAYERVVGITAVDARHRVYRQAGRGPHVMFAAPGVRIRVARAGGGYTTDSGTSMAAPYAAAIIAASLHALEASPDLVLQQHKAAAQGLGESDFNSAWGYGLITPLRTAPAAAQTQRSP